MNTKPTDTAASYATRRINGGDSEAAAPIKPPPMKQITARKFKAAIKLDPAWALTLTEPVEITGYCNMGGSEVSHLSPLLHFAGRNAKGNAASFSCCKNLKVAEGTFAGCVQFDESGVETIGKLHVTSPNTNGFAAHFCHCEKLKVAEGTFQGMVCFSYSGITRIGELITAADSEGNAAYFNECERLKVADGAFPGCVSFCGSGVERVSKLVIAKANCDNIKANFLGCDIRLPAEFLGPEYVMDDSTRRKNLGRIAASKAIGATPALEI
jgi:hypothetical protein